MSPLSSVTVVFRVKRTDFFFYDIFPQKSSYIIHEVIFNKKKSDHPISAAMLLAKYLFILHIYSRYLKNSEQLTRYFSVHLPIPT